MRRPSVIFINRIYPPARGATGRVLRDLAHSFAAEGWNVTVITTGPKAQRERDGEVQVLRIRGARKPGLPGYLAIWVQMLILLLRQRRADLIVTMTDPPLLVAAGRIFKSLKGGRHINWCQDLYPDILPALNIRLPHFAMKLFKSLSRRAMDDADKVIVVGRCMARRLSGEGIDGRRISMIPNWPDSELLENLSETAESGSFYNGKAGAKPYEEQRKTRPRFRVLYAGNIGRAHPIDTILEAAQILNETHPDIEFVFVGSGPKFDEIAHARSVMNLDNLRLVPYQPARHLRQVMESGDLHLISVKDEAAGMLVPSKIYSALAVHRPCIFIGPSACEAARVIMDFGAGAVIAQGEPHVLAEHISRYRMNGEDWFQAHTGAAEAGRTFLPEDAMNAWIEKAWTVVRADLGERR